MMLHVWMCFPLPVSEVCPLFEGRTSMKAARWHGRRDVRIDVVPVPTPGPQEVVLRVDWCGICGTDMEEYLTGPHWIAVGHPNPLTHAQAPLTLGHEFCGAPEAMCIPLPPSLSSDRASLAETLAVGVHALRRGRLSPGETVAIVGAGAVGLCTLQAALHMGARRALVLEPDAMRRRLALTLGARAAFDPREDGWADALREELRSPGLDLVIECAGHIESVSSAIKAARRGGRIVVVGLPPMSGTLDFTALAGEEKEIIGSISHVYDEDFVAAVDLLASGRVHVDSLITHRIGLSEVVTNGFERLAAGDRSAIKIIVQPSS